MGLGRRDESFTALERERDLYRGLAESDPADRRSRGDWAQAELLYGDTLWRDYHRAREGRESIDRARGMLEELVAADPSQSQFRKDLALTYGALASRLGDEGKREEALAYWSRTIAQYEALFRDNPADPTIGHDLVRNLGNMGIILASAGRRLDALEAEDRAREVLEQVGAAHPTLRLVPADRAWLDLASAINLTELGRNEEALATLERARAAREAQRKANPSVPRYPAQLALIHRRVGVIHRRAGRPGGGPGELRTGAGVRGAAGHRLPGRHGLPARPRRGPRRNTRGPTVIASPGFRLSTSMIESPIE